MQTQPAQPAQSQWQSILRLPEVIRQTGLSKSSIYRLESLGQFPARVKLSEAACGWKSEDVQGWIASRPLVAAGKE